MRIFLWILILTSIVSAAPKKYSIQVLSVDDKTSITQAFMDKVNATGMSYTQKSVDGEYRVYMGEFPNEEAAASALNEVRTKIAEDAFICESEGAVALSPQQKMQQAMLMAQARTLKKMKTAEPKVEEKTLETVEPIKVDIPVKKIEITRKDTKRVEPMNEDVKTEEMFCKTSKKALRESEISEALAFYRNSSYYKFRK